MSAPIRAEIAALARLAVPIVVARVGVLSLGLVDALMVARLGAEALAFYGLGSMTAEMLVGPMVGILLGISIVAARHFGAREFPLAGAVWRRGLGLALLVGLSGLGLTLLAGPLFRLAGHDPVLAGEAAQISFIVGLSYPAFALFLATSFFLEAINRPNPAVWVLLIGNLVNILANWLLIHELGYGALGCAIATNIVRLVMAALLIAYVWRMRGRYRYAVRLRPRAGWWRGGRETRSAGYAGAGSEMFDAAGFALFILMAGALGVVAAASFTLVINLYAVLIMIGFGVAGAVLVRVGNARGAGDPQGMRRAGWTGIGFCAAVSLVPAALLAGFAGPLAALVTPDPVLIAAMPPLLILCAVFLISDSTQIVAAHASRGAGDGLAPTIINAIVLMGVGVPLGWWLAFAAERGTIGLFQGLLAFSIAGCVGQTARFWWRARVAGRAVIEQTDPV